MLDRSLAAPPVAAAASPRIVAPPSDSRTCYQTLAYLEARDAVTGDDHAFVAYKETNVANGSWRVRVRSLQTAGGVFEPLAMAQQAQAAQARGEPYFVWGYQLAPSPGDARQIEFRVHVQAGRPARLELYARLRQADHGPAPARSVVCDWPQA